MADLTIQSLSDRGKTKETLKLSVDAPCNLNNYMIADRTFDSKGAVSNLHRHVFRFPDQAVKKGDTVLLKTGKGAHTKTPDGLATIYTYFWGLDVAVWNNEGDQTVLYKVEVVEAATFKNKTPS